MLQVQSALGLVALVAFAWALSERHRAVRPGLVLAGLAVQLVLAGLLFWLPPLRALFGAVNEAVLALQAATDAGSGFVFGYLGGAPLPFETTRPGAAFILAFRALPLLGTASCMLTSWSAGLQRTAAAVCACNSLHSAAHSGLLLTSY